MAVFPQLVPLCGRLALPTFKNADRNLKRIKIVFW
jgi:hypothetical protein